MRTQINQSAFDAEEFALYRKYQIAVHNDEPEDVGEGSYCRFLVDSPLIRVAPGNGGSTPSCGYSTFHQQYRIDEKLVALESLTYYLIAFQVIIFSGTLIWLLYFWASILLYKRLNGSRKPTRYVRHWHITILVSIYTLVQRCGIRLRMHRQSFSAPQSTYGYPMNKHCQLLPLSNISLYHIFLCKTSQLQRALLRIMER